MNNPNDKINFTVKIVNWISAEQQIKPICEVVEINKVLENNLHSINTDPECENNSWILKLKPIK